MGITTNVSIYTNRSTVRGEPVEPLETQQEPFDRLTTDGFNQRVLKLTHKLFTTFLLLWATVSHADNKYIVTYVYDGDTVKLRNTDGEIKLRLSEIDAPERNQDYGLKSRRALINLCRGKSILVKVKITGTDQYNRSLGKLQCNHVDAGTYLVEHGLAWHYAKYSTDTELHNAELQARQQKRGLWRIKNPTPPWAWRQNKSL
jgi:endonuclease YncB( thermonuclease family)